MDEPLVLPEWGLFQLLFRGPSVAGELFYRRYLSREVEDGALFLIHLLISSEELVDPERKLNIVAVLLIVFFSLTMFICY